MLWDGSLIPQRYEDKIIYIFNHFIDCQSLKQLHPIQHFLYINRNTVISVVHNLYKERHKYSG